MSELFENMTEDEKSAALLDYVKGRVSDDLRRNIDTVAQSDMNVAEEIAYYNGLASAVQKPAESAPFDELGWSRLVRDLDQEKQTDTAPIAANDNNRIWRFATAALAFIALGQATFFTIQDTGQNEQATYETVSETSEGFSLQVTFTPNVTESEIRTLFLKTGANITRGPSALGIYEVTFKDEAGRVSATKIFKEKPEIVLSVYKK
ncbi:hypothetical protein [Kordiimonas aquimaris]|uniref:hypothetical protein n=1 Tax=Kordiimonas aquimaris TaxID=707591 RepID=UPI0021CF4CFC|nr:hypothetical protein [Kordiimonas aquimaris]